MESEDNQGYRQKRLDKELLDLGSSFTRELSEDRLYRTGWSDDWRTLRCLQIQPSKKYRRYLLEPSVLSRCMPETMVPVRYCHTALNKNQANKTRYPVTQSRWTPDGKWLITGAQNGEFTLWSGLDFSFNRMISGHDKAIKCLQWSRSGEWMVSGDQEGNIRVWSTAIAHLKAFKQAGELDRAHADCVRGISFSPTDARLASCSDDLTVRIWDFGNQLSEETKIQTHDVRAIDWHKSRGLFVTGSRDHSCKLWDPRQGGKMIRNIGGHKQTVNVVKWHPTHEEVFMSAGKDYTVRIHDLRMLRRNNMNSNHHVCLSQWKAHDAEIHTGNWHPTVPDLLATGAHDGSLAFWIVSGSSTETARQAYTPTAHEGAIWDLDWHPLGHMLCSGSNDHTAKFWARPKPGDIALDLYRGYNQTRGLSEVQDLITTGKGSLPTNYGEFKSIKEEDAALLQTLADSVLPNVGRIGLECASQQAGLVLPPPPSMGLPQAQQSLLVQLPLQQQQQLLQPHHHHHHHRLEEDPVKRLQLQREAEINEHKRYRGSVRKWDEKGFGFILPFDPKLPSTGIFAHATSIVPGKGSGMSQNGESEVLIAGNVVEFSFGYAENRKTGEMQPKASEIIDEKFFDKDKPFVGVESLPASATGSGAASNRPRPPPSYPQPPSARPQQQSQPQQQQYHAHPGISHSMPPPPLPEPPRQQQQAPPASMQLNPEYLATMKLYLERGHQQAVEEDLARNGLKLSDILPYLYRT